MSDGVYRVWCCRVRRGSNGHGKPLIKLAFSVNNKLTEDSTIPNLHHFIHFPVSHIDNSSYLPTDPLSQLPDKKLTIPAIAVLAIWTPKIDTREKLAVLVGQENQSSSPREPAKPTALTTRSEQHAHQSRNRAAHAISYVNTARISQSSQIHPVR